jgi:asparagine synthase (glutamine-hydrolysing)
MCGISGAVATSGAGVTDLRKVVERMVSRQVHRGPDDSGTWDAPGVVLGHNRLSIIDRGGGHQPMHDESGRYTIVFNGEIYNYREIRQLLEANGHRFVSNSDTEVLLRLYIAHGEDCLSRLNGMFAFGIWDGLERTLFLARDRLGVKPLYYWLRDSELRFSSELGALAGPGDGLEIDREAVVDYLSCLYVPAPRTIYSEIKKLLPGHSLLWMATGVTIRRYWFPWTIVPDEQPSAEDWIERLRALFVDSVRLRLVSDVPLGAFLSGGIDSSAVVTTMATLMAEPVKTFTIGFNGDTSSELPYARSVVDRCHTDHVERVVSAPDVPAFLDLICEHFGEPFADSSAIPTLLVSQLARERVTVALSGDGGDELFAGYGSYRYYERLSRVESALGGIAPFAGHVASMVPNWLSRQSALASKARTFMSKLGRPLDEQWSMSRSVLSRGSAASALARPLRDQFEMRKWHTHLAPYFAAVSNQGVIDQLTRVDMQTYLADDLLAKVDRTSMAASLEVRSPFLDYRLVELALSIPMRFKLKNGQGKWLLQRMLEGHVPSDILWRTKKGFNMPLDQWFRGDLYKFAREVLLDSGACDDIFDRHGIEMVLLEHKRGEAEHSSFIWAMIVLQTWLARQKLVTSL